MIDLSSDSDLSALCSAWKIGSLLTTWIPETGTIHRTILLKTAQGDYALRAYRYGSGERWRIVYEHALISFVYARGLPVLPPLCLTDGETILCQHGQFYALYPFARGHQTPKAELSAQEIGAMGQFLAELHQVLRDYPQEQVHQREFTVDHDATLAKIAEIEQAICAQPQQNEHDLQALTRLAQRRNWLTTMPPLTTEGFLQLEHQVIHGDYQETNVFFNGEKVSAIIDWDQAYVAPRAWEIVRTLHLAFHLEPVASQTFLNAYRREMPLPASELEIAAAAYGWRRAHYLWLYVELYLQGNQRVRAFLQSEGPFIPFAEKWARLRRALR